MRSRWVGVAELKLQTLIELNPDKWSASLTKTSLSEWFVGQIVKDIMETSANDVDMIRTLVQDRVHSEQGAILAKAKQMYDHYADNHPTIHSNRFGTFGQLPTKEKNDWIAKARE